MSKVARFQMPDGRVARFEVPDDTTPEAAQAMIQSQISAQAPQESATAGQGLAQGFAERAVGNIAGIPEFIARGARGGANVLRAATGQEMQPIPPEGLLGIPSGREILSGVEAGLGGLLGQGGDFSQRFENVQQRRQQTAQQQPTATSVGDVGADIATIATGRAPLVRGPGGLFDRPVKELVEEGGEKLARKAGDTGVRKAAKDIVQSDLFKDLARGVGRAGETGIEGMALAVLQNGDPVETAALSAGTQLAASGGLGLADSITDFPLDVIGKATGKKPTGVKAKAFALMTEAALAGGMFQLFKSLTPGGRDFILESEEAGYNKIAGILLLGGMGALLGKRSKPEGLLEAFPKLADAATTIGRGAMISNLEDLASDEGDEMERVIQRITQNPSAFTEQQIDTLRRGLQNGNFKSRVQKLMQDDDFRKKIEAPHPDLADVPIRDEAGG